MLKRKDDVENLNKKHIFGNIFYLPEILTATVKVTLPGLFGKRFVYRV
jgi:hypothetical protein